MSKPEVRVYAFDYRKDVCGCERANTFFSFLTFNDFKKAINLLRENNFVIHDDFSKWMYVDDKGGLTTLPFEHRDEDDE